MPKPLDVLGVRDFAAKWGVSPQLANKFSQRDDFPEPAAELAAGRIWRTADVRRWVKKHRPDLKEEK